MMHIASISRFRNAEAQAVQLWHDASSVKTPNRGIHSYYNGTYATKSAKQKFFIVFDQPALVNFA